MGKRERILYVISWMIIVATLVFIYAEAKKADAETALLENKLEVMHKLTPERINTALELGWREALLVVALEAEEAGDYQAVHRYMDLAQDTARYQHLLMKVK